MLWCYINGGYFPANEGKIGITDLGLTRGYAVFDYLRTYNGKPFRLEDYLNRFHQSAQELMLRIPVSDEAIAGILHELRTRSNLQEAAFRLILTGGYAKDSITSQKPNFIINTEHVPVYPPDVYDKGVSLITYEFQRVLPYSKTTNYLIALKLEPVKKARNAFDVLYVFENKALELTRNNFFIFRGNTLVTPRANVLQGITRKIVLELAASHYAIEERDLPMEEVRQADEAFISGTSKQIIPVIKIDDFFIGTGIPGNRTRHIMQLFKDYVSNW